MGQGYGRLFVAAQSRLAGQDPGVLLGHIDSFEGAKLGGNSGRNYLGNLEISWPRHHCYGAEWVGGIDFPFGMPLEALERFGWLKGSGPQSWAGYIEALHRDVENDLEKFRERVESWKKSGKTGNDKRVFLLRHTDKLSGFAQFRRPA
jgi:hypothetical protein